MRACNHATRWAPECQMSSRFQGIKIYLKSVISGGHICLVKDGLAKMRTVF
jgi:hypothetical protein